MKTLIIVLTVVIILGVGVTWLKATPALIPPTALPPASNSVASNSRPAPSPVPLAVAVPNISTPSAGPATILVNTFAVVTITASITPTPTANSVNLLRLGPPGTQPAILGVMHDDGKNGDTVAGDGIYTLQLPFQEMTAGQIQLEVSAAFPGRLQRLISSPVVVQVWNVTQPPAGSGITSAIVYPPTWVAQPSSPSPSGGLYFSDSSEEEAGTGISVVLINAPLDSLLVDSGDTPISQSSQVINGRQWSFTIEQEPDSGLRFYHAFLQTSSGVIAIGGNDSPSNEAIVMTMVSQFQ